MLPPIFPPSRNAFLLLYFRIVISICIRGEKRRKKKQIYQAVITRGSGVDKSRGGRPFPVTVSLIIEEREIEERDRGGRGFRLLADISKGCARPSIDAI